MENLAGLSFCECTEVLKDPVRHAHFTQLANSDEKSTLPLSVAQKKARKALQTGPPSLKK